MSPPAERGLAALPRGAAQRVVVRMRALAEEPRPHGCRKLQGEDGFYRIRIGDYRVIYGIEDDRLIVLVVDVGHRRDIYRGT